MFWGPGQLQESNVPKLLCRTRPSLLSLTRWKHFIILYHYRHSAVSWFHALIDLTAFCKQAIIGGSSEMMACGESDWQYAPAAIQIQRWASGLNPRMDGNLKPPMKLMIKSKYQFDSWLLQRFLLSVAPASASWWVFLLFLFFLFPQSNPVDLPPAHQLHLHWLAIRRRHWHLRASVCAQADVYSTTQGCGLMHYTGITFWIVLAGL